jgi:Asp-tRNA(Asn)/Glu-tRNA(Gln) amidotransferase A subunit family amidase
MASIAWPEGGPARAPGERRRDHRGGGAGDGLGDSTSRPRRLGKSSLTSGKDRLETPTALIAAPRIDTRTVKLGETECRVRGPGSGVVSRCTSPGNATGLPAIIVPCGSTQAGLPIGIQFIGRLFDEVRLLQVAHAREAVSPSRGRRPALVDAGLP